MGRKTMRRWAVLGVALALTVGATPVVLAQDAPVPEGAMSELGEGEGALEVIAWAGYVEDGGNDPSVDWVSSFEEEHRLPGERHPGQHVRRDVHAHADRQL